MLRTAPRGLVDTSAGTRSFRIAEGGGQAAAVEALDEAGVPVLVRSSHVSVVAGEPTCVLALCYDGVRRDFAQLPWRKDASLLKREPFRKLLPPLEPRDFRGTGCIGPGARRYQ